MEFQGTFSAVVTPFSKGAVDFEAIGHFTRIQIEGGVSGLVAVGTTGESPTLDHGEHMDVIRCYQAAASGRVPIVAGTGSNATSEAVELTRMAHDAGVDAMLVVTPYYNKPSQEGLYRYFAEIAETTDRPIILYSIPGRCVIEIGIPLMERLLTRYPHVRIIKEAGGSCERVSQIRRAFGDAMTILSGDDSLTLPFMSLGARGVISVASNLLPREVSALTGAALEGNFVEALKVHERLYTLFNVLFSEPNPVPVKQAMAWLGILPNAEVRSPLCPMSEANLSELKIILQDMGVLI